MSKRGRLSDAEMEGPPSKMKCDDMDDGGGRTGRVRKKSAKVIEMEEFEQVEKTHHGGKKSKTPKGAAATSVKNLGVDNMDTPAAPPSTPPAPKQKAKTPKDPPTALKSALAASLMQAPISVTPAAPPKSTKVGGSGAKGSQAAKPVAQFVPVQTGGVLTASNATEMLAAVIKKEAAQDETPDQSQQSVIKYLLNSPASGSKASPVSIAADSVAEQTAPSGKKSSVSKKSKVVAAQAEKAGGKAVKPGKSKSTKVKLELGGEEEGGVGVGGEYEFYYDEALRTSAAGLKMRISASSDPQSAQVTLNPEEAAASAKPKKSSKKTKEPVDLSSALIKTESDDVGSPPAKKAVKKVFKKKEKLIQEAISAALQVPATDIDQSEVKAVKKKKKVKIADQSSPGQLGSPDAYGDDGGEEESTLVIAETEKKKKKTLTKKKPPKEIGSPADAKGEDEKKLSKRAPTAYMLFCNTHRPSIVSENPGIEFAGISRKLGEMWQTLSTKQKLQWRRKAQRRMKRGSNIISTGKTGKEAAAAVTPQLSGLALVQPSATPSGAASVAAHTAAGSSAAVRFLNMANSRSPVETPQSPTKLNFSIEPVDVAAHLKLLGESLSIIGMRLQEHKGMIAVQGSLSVLLDSLLCACGPLLCLTQQVPDMDGCDPLVHAQTLDSVAYVMPGL